jgi:ribosomal protein S18 acetylase RimI-like enzyme
VRRARLSDAHTIAAIAASCSLNVTADTAGGFLLNGFATEDYAMMVSHGALTLICESDNGEVCGFVVVAPFAQIDEAQLLGITRNDAVEIAQVAVSPEFRHRGIGRRLYEQMLTELGDEQRIVATVTTSPVENTASLIFHEKLGFTAVGDIGEGGGLRQRLFVRQPVSS